MELKSGWSRRDFVKASVAAAAASVVGIPVPAWALAENGWRWDKAVCRFCGVGCGLRIATEGGKVVAVNHGPAQDRLVIERDGVRFEIPFVDAFVPVVDVDGGYVETTEIEGLTEPSS